jgi:hypothetical protein
MIITLLPDELKVLGELAKQRHLPKRAIGIKKNFEPTTKGGVEGDFIGIKGEYAVAKHFQVAFDSSIHYHGDDGIDLVVGDKTIQVKSTFYSTGRVIYNMEDEFVTDYVILAITDELMPNVRLVGWADKSLWNTKHRIKYMGYGDRKVLDQYDLRPMRELVIPHEAVDPYQQIKALL